MFTDFDAEERNDRLSFLARRLLAADIGLFGSSWSKMSSAIPQLTAEGVNDDLFERMIALTGNGALFEKPLRILEIGCGGGAFTFSALKRGHDAYGIDNDPDRLALAYEKIRAYGYPAEWSERIQFGDAMRLAFPRTSFDIVLGWQVIEHIPSAPAALFESARVLKTGGLMFFWAPDYRAPFEAHYGMPWPPFASPDIARDWVIAMGRPTGGINTFYNISLPQLRAAVEVLGCRVFAAGIDRDVSAALAHRIDTSSTDRLCESARAMRAAMEAGALPVEYTSPTSMTLAAQKVL